MARAQIGTLKAKILIRHAASMIYPSSSDGSVREPGKYTFSRDLSDVRQLGWYEGTGGYHGLSRNTFRPGLVADFSSGENWSLTDNDKARLLAEVPHVVGVSFGENPLEFTMDDGQAFGFKTLDRISDFVVEGGVSQSEYEADPDIINQKATEYAEAGQKKLVAMLASGQVRPFKKDVTKTVTFKSKLTNEDEPFQLTSEMVQSSKELQEAIVAEVKKLSDSVEYFNYEPEVKFTVNNWTAIWVSLGLTFGMSYEAVHEVDIPVYGDIGGGGGGYAASAISLSPGEGGSSAIDDVELEIKKLYDTHLMGVINQLIAGIPWNPSMAEIYVKPKLDYSKTSNSEWWEKSQPMRDYATAVQAMPGGRDVSLTTDVAAKHPDLTPEEVKAKVDEMANQAKDPSLFSKFWTGLKAVGNKGFDLIKEWGPVQTVGGWAAFEAVKSAKNSSIPTWMLIGGAGLLALLVLK